LLIGSNKIKFYTTKLDINKGGIKVASEPETTYGIINNKIEHLPDFTTCLQNET